MADEVNAVETAQNEAPQLSLQDIATMVQIIDVCSKRGGFEGPELEAVGGLRNRVVAFLNAVAPKDGDAPEGDLPAEEDPAESAESAES
ncbi:MAG: hypothetical protein CMQ15_11285 [Gammaproteobacteria bacterium]|jgi:hypothetical protein|nr:hypothetical protein [Gammaproteobacteria bacterium]